MIANSLAAVALTAQGRPLELLTNEVITNEHTDYSLSQSSSRWRFSSFFFWPSAVHS